MAETKVDGYTVRGYFEQSPIIPLYHVTNSGKESRINDSAIPFILGAAGIVLAVIYKLAIHTPQSAGEALSAVFAGFTQGILCAAASVYVNNIKKQATIKKEDSEDTDNEKDA